MKNLLLIAALSVGLLACDKIDKADKAMDKVSAMSDTTNEMNGGMKSTNDSIRMQKMGICKDDINSDYAAAHLYPVPTGLIACGKIFAESATAKEVTEYVYLILKQIDEVQPLKNFGADGQEQDFTLEQQNKFLRDNYRDFQAVMTIAGFLPDATVQGLINEQANEGAYRPTMLKILFLRALFLRQIQVQNKYLDKGVFATTGQAEETIETMKKVEFILRLPFANELAIKTVGLQGPEGYNGPISNADMTLDADTKAFLTSGWASIAELAESSLTVNPHQGPAEAAARLAKQQAIIKEARAYAKGWEEAQP